MGNCEGRRVLAESRILQRMAEERRPIVLLHQTKSTFIHSRYLRLPASFSKMDGGREREARNRCVAYTAMRDNMRREAAVLEEKGAFCALELDI